MICAFGELLSVIYWVIGFEIRKSKFESHPSLVICASGDLLVVIHSVKFIMNFGKKVTIFL